MVGAIPAWGSYRNSRCLHISNEVGVLDFITGVILLQIFQQHSFYELIINKARGKSGPVISIFLFFYFLGY